MLKDEIKIKKVWDVLSQNLKTEKLQKKIFKEKKDKKFNLSKSGKKKLKQEI